MSLAILQFNSHDIEIFEISNEYYILETDLTRAIGATRNAIYEQRRRNTEVYNENKHIILHTIRGQRQKRVLWSPRGVSRLLMRMNTPLALKFQDFLEDHIEDLRKGKTRIVSTDLDFIMSSARKIANQINFNKVTLGIKPNEEMYDIILKCLLEDKEGIRDGDPLEILIERWENDTVPLLSEAERRLLKL